MNKGIISVFFILVGAALSAPFFFGNSIEDRFNHEVKKAQKILRQMDSGLALLEENYQKGWFSSSSRLVLTINNQKIPIENKITHGPFSYFGLGKIESTITIDKSNSEEQDEIIQLFSGQTPLSITTKMGFSNTVIDILSPIIDNKSSLSKSPHIVHWGGAKGTITINANNLTTNIEIPKLKIVEENNFITIKNAVIKGQLFGSHNRDSDATNMVSLNIENVAFNNETLLFTNTLNLSTRLTVDDTYLSSDTTLKLTNIEIPKELGITIADNNLVEANFSLANIPKRALLDYGKRFGILADSGKAITDTELLFIFEPFLINYLQGTPSLKAHLIIKDTEKNVSVYFDTRLPKADLTTKTFEQALASAAERIEVTLTTNFSDTFLNVLDKQGMLPTPKEDFIQSILENNRFTLKNGEFTNKTEYKKDHIYSNGQPAPLLDASIPYLLESLFD